MQCMHVHLGWDEVSNSKSKFTSTLDAFSIGASERVAWWSVGVVSVCYCEGSVLSRLFLNGDRALVAPLRILLEAINLALYCP